MRAICRVEARQGIRVRTGLAQVVQATGSAGPTAAKDVVQGANVRRTLRDPINVIDARQILDERPSRTGLPWVRIGPILVLDLVILAVGAACWFDILTNR